MRLLGTDGCPCKIGFAVKKHPQPCVPTTTTEVTHSQQPAWRHPRFIQKWWTIIHIDSNTFRHHRLHWSGVYTVKALANVVIKTWVWKASRVKWWHPEPTCVGSLNSDYANCTYHHVNDQTLSQTVHNIHGYVWVCICVHLLLFLASLSQNALE